MNSCVPSSSESAPPTIGRLLADATRLLHATSPTPRLDADILLAHVLGWSRARLLAERDSYPAPDQETVFWQLVQRRARLEPVAYLVGHREFYGFDLQVDRRVLVPRPETELLVELALDQAQTASAMRVVDVGTGSGAVAVALAAYLPQAQIYATDLSRDALEVAAANLARHGLAQRVVLLQGDLLEPLPGPVDMIVSNPPYTVLGDIDAGVRQHEPHLALDGGPDGLAIYRRLLAQAPRWLRAGSGAALLCEIDAPRAAAARALAQAAFPAAEVRIQRDLAGHERVVVVRM